MLRSARLGFTRTSSRAALARAAWLLSLRPLPQPPTRSTGLESSHSVGASPILSGEHGPNLGRVRRSCPLPLGAPSSIDPRAGRRRARGLSPFRVGRIFRVRERERLGSSGHKLKDLSRRPVACGAAVGARAKLIDPQPIKGTGWGRVGSVTGQMRGSDASTGVQHRSEWVEKENIRGPGDRWTDLGFRQRMNLRRCSLLDSLTRLFDSAGAFQKKGYPSSSPSGDPLHRRLGDFWWRPDLFDILPMGRASNQRSLGPRWGPMLVSRTRGAAPHLHWGAKRVAAASIRSALKIRSGPFGYGMPWGRLRHAQGRAHSPHSAHPSAGMGAFGSCM